MRKATLLFLSAAPLSVLAAAAWAQQVIYPQKPSPAVPYAQQGQPEAMTYEQALAQQQSLQTGQGISAPGAGSNSGKAAPVAVDPDGNPIFGGVGSSNTQPMAGNASRNEAQLEAERLRQDPAAAEQSQQASTQAPQNDTGSYAQQQAYPQQNQQQYAQPQASSQQAYTQPGYRQQPGYAQPNYSQPGYPQRAYPQQQGYAQQGYPQQSYAQPRSSDNVPDQGYGYSQSASQPPVVVTGAYGAYPSPVPPPVVAYGYPYPYSYRYPYGYGVGIRIGGYYGGGYYRGGYGFRGGYGGRGFVGGVRGGFGRGGRR